MPIQSDGAEGGERAPAAAAVRRFARELYLGFASSTLWRLPFTQAANSNAANPGGARGPERSGTPAPAASDEDDALERSRALAYLPVAGFVLGVTLALVDRALSELLGAWPRSALVLGISLAASGGLNPLGVARSAQVLAGAVDAATGRPSRSHLSGALAALVMVGLELICLGMIAPLAARARALLLATMLARWSVVPLGYGLRPLDSAGLGLPYQGGIRFREFALSSVLALGLAMGLYEIVGLAAVVPAALVVLLLRLLLSRRMGGAAGHALAAGSAVCELLVMAAMAALPF